MGTYFYSFHAAVNHQLSVLRIAFVLPFNCEDLRRTLYPGANLQGSYIAWPQPSCSYKIYTVKRRLRAKGISFVNGPRKKIKNDVNSS